MNNKTLEKIRNSKVMGFTKHDIFKELTEKKIINISRATFYRQLLIDSKLKEIVYTLIFDSLSSIKKNVYMLLNSTEQNEIIQVSKYLLSKYENKTESDYIQTLKQNDNIIDSIIDNKTLSSNDDTMIEDNKTDIELFEDIQKKSNSIIY